MAVEESTSIQWVNSIALRKAEIAYNFGLSECNRVKKCSCCKIDFSVQKHLETLFSILRVADLFVYISFIEMALNCIRWPYSDDPFNLNWILYK